MKFIAQIVASLLGSILVGIAGLAYGVTLGGNLGFPSFGGYTAGYEAAGVFFSIIGISTGSLLGIVVAKNLQNKSQKNLAAAIITAVIMAIIGVNLAYYYMPTAISLTILLTPTAVLIPITNWQNLFQKKANETK